MTYPPGRQGLPVQIRMNEKRRIVSRSRISELRSPGSLPQRLVHLLLPLLVKNPGLLMIGLDTESNQAVLVSGPWGVVVWPGSKSFRPRARSGRPLSYPSSPVSAWNSWGKMSRMPPFFEPLISRRWGGNLRLWTFGSPVPQIS